VTRALALAAALAAGQALLVAPAWAGPDTRLSLSGAPVRFTLPAHSFTTRYYVDIPDSGVGTGGLSILTNGQGSDDIDLLVRYGDPFPESYYGGVTADTMLLFRSAHYRSISSGSVEQILITPSGYYPLRAGRWYVAVLNSSSHPAPVSLEANAVASTDNAGIRIDFDRSGTDCDTAPWNDSTPATPIGGNGGTTVGQQRRNALLHAAELLADELRPPVEITVRACWKALGGTSTRAVLANAAPTYVLLDEYDSPMPWLPLKHTWYAIAAASRLGGASPCSLVGGSCNQADVVATFNSDIGSSTVLGGADFYYGLTPGASPSDAADFVSIAMHELTHGLGFLGLVNTDPDAGALGARFSASGSGGYDGPGYDDAFSVHAAIVDADGADYAPFLAPEIGDAERADALVSVDGLRWLGQEAVQSPANHRTGTPPENFPLLYAPCGDPNGNGPCGTEPGSTLSHTNQSGELMNAIYVEAARSLGLARPMLDAIGWSNAATPAPPTYTQPIPSNWYDPDHSGHGFDLRKLARDPALGDVYYVAFYTFDRNGDPDFYVSVGTILDGVFVSGPDDRGRTLQHPVYDPTLRRVVSDPNSGGSLTLDFNQAANAPACRGRDRGAHDQLTVMSWTIDGESGQWCMQPIVALEQHPAPDFNGLYYGGSSDSGWGISVLQTDRSPERPYLNAIVYYPGADNRIRWAIGEADAFASGDAFALYSPHGYCRTCAKVPVTTQAAGTMALGLTLPQSEGTTPSGANRLTIDLRYPGDAASFRRDDVPLSLESLVDPPD
jgi:hypothetical protein